MRPFQTYAYAAFIILTSVLSQGQTQTADPSSNYGIVPYNTYLGENEDINLGSGNLHIQIPLLKLPGRNGHDFVFTLSYNSQIWYPSSYTAAGAPPGQQPQTYYFWLRNTPWGWNLPTLQWDTNGVPTNPNDSSHICYQANFRVRMWDGRVVYFPGVRNQCVYVAQNGTQTSDPASNQLMGASAEYPTPGSLPCSDYWHFSLSSSTSISPYIVMESGETLWFGSGGGVAYLSKDVDSNGNTISYSTTGTGVQITDTVGRTITVTGVLGSSNPIPPTSITYPDPDANGATKTINFNTSSFTFAPTFGMNPPFPEPTSGTINLLSSIVLQNGDTFTFDYNPYAELKKITYPTGGYARYEYTPVSVNTGMGFNTPQRELQRKYVCRDFSGSCTQEPEEMTTLSPVGTTAYPARNATNSILYPVSDHVDLTFVGNAYESQRKIYSAGSSSPLRTVDTSQGCTGVASRQISLDDGQVSRVEMTHGDTYNGNNVTERREYAYGNGSPGPLARKTVTTYLHLDPSLGPTYRATALLKSGSVHILNRKMSGTVIDMITGGSGTTVAQTKYLYDTYTPSMVASAATQLDPAYIASAGYTTRGNVTSTQRWLNPGNTWLTTSNAYDDGGNVLSTTDPGGHTTSFSYTDNFTDGINHNSKAYVTTTTAPTTNGVSHIERKQYYWHRGLVAAGCGQNYSGAACIYNAGLPQPDYATFSYDLQGRQTNITNGDGGSSSTTYSDNSSQNRPFNGTQTQTIATGVSLINQSFWNGLGDVYQTKILSDPDGIDIVDTTYDTVGRQETVSNPHRTASATTDGTTMFNTYDGLSRLTLLTKQDGSTVTTNYYGNAVTVTDEAGKQRRSYTDALGRLVRVDEPGNVPIPPTPGTPGAGWVGISGQEQNKQIQCGPPGTFCTIWDSGSVSVTVNGFQVSASYYQTDTPTTIATVLTTALNGGASPVTASRSGSTITLTAKTTGVATNYSLTTSVTWNSNFTNPSFAASTSGSTLTGGSDANPGNPATGPPSIDTPWVTLYAYDVLSNLVRVDQKGNQPTDSAQWRTRTFNYDSLSRLKCAANPEITPGLATVNPALCPTTDSGTYTAGITYYTYDSDGNVVTKTMPKANQLSNSVTVIATYSYDELHRLKQKSYNDSSTATVKYGYDGTALSACTTTPPTLTDTYPKGRRTAMCDGSGATSWDHDLKGRTSHEKRTIVGSINVTNQVTYTYNLDDSLATLTYPNTGRVITYVPGAAGRPLTAQDIAGSTNYVQNVHYAPFGGLTSMTNGLQPITITNVYNPRFQPLYLSAATTSATILSLCYDFQSHVALSYGPCSLPLYTSGNNGNVFKIINNRDTLRTQIFAYDALNRIQQANSSGSGATSWGETFTIDAWGNLTNRGPVAGKTNYESLSAALASGKNQLNGFCNDAAGNLVLNVTCPTGTLSPIYNYDAENRLTSTAGYTYVYDGDGKRVKKCNSCASASGGTLYWTGIGNNNLSESDLGGTIQKEYIFFNGKRVARRDVPGTPSVKYYFSDHLGSGSMITNSTGTMPPLEESDYYPYGGEMAITNGDPNNYKFTGKERDAESGLDYFGARLFSSASGRWQSVDPLSGSAKGINPQTLNRYSYTLNRPLVAVDLDGLLTIIIGGTSNGDPTYGRPGTSFHQAVQRNFHDDNVVVFPWSGSLSGRGRAATELATFIKNNLKSGEALNIVAHSHGGNVAKLYTQLPMATHVDVLLTLGTPNRKDIPINPDKVGTYINAYSRNDGVQLMGGCFIFFCGVSRKDPNAVNIEESAVGMSGGAAGHSDLHTANALDDIFLGGRSDGPYDGPGDPMSVHSYDVWDGGNVGRQGGLSGPSGADWAFGALNALIDSHECAVHHNCN